MKHIAQVRYCQNPMKNLIKTSYKPLDVTEHKEHFTLSVLYQHHPVCITFDGQNMGPLAGWNKITRREASAPMKFINGSDTIFVWMGPMGFFYIELNLNNKNSVLFYLHSDAALAGIVELSELRFGKQLTPRNTSKVSISQFLIDHKQRKVRARVECCYSCIFIRTRTMTFRLEVSSLCKKQWILYEDSLKRCDMGSYDDSNGFSIEHERENVHLHMYSKEHNWCMTTVITREEMKEITREIVLFLRSDRNTK